MKSLQTFSDAGTPLLEDFGTAAPSLTDATETLTPFSEALTVSLKSLGNAGEASGPLFAEADPVVKKARDLAKSGVEPTGDLAKLLVNIKQTGGWDGLDRTDLQHDRIAQRLRQVRSLRPGAGDPFRPASNTSPFAAGTSGCVARFNGPNAPEGQRSTEPAPLNSSDF